MLKWSCIPVFVLALSLRCAAQAPEGSATWYDDATLLTLDLQQGIALDSGLYREIAAALDLARSVDDTLKGIGCFPAYVPDDLLVAVSGSWAQAWYDSVLVTGFAAIDSLTALYGALRVRPLLLGGWYVLTFERPLRMDLLAAEFKKIPGVAWAEPNGTIGDGNRIEAFKKSGAWHFAMSYGWGDCPAGCAHRSYWYVRVDSSGAVLEGTLPDPWFLPIMHRWNIPARYAATVFADVDAIRASLRDPVWWVRRHALSVLGRIVTATYPWVGEDLTPPGRFDSLRAGVLALRVELAAAVYPLLQDPDPDVAAEAIWAHQRLLGLASPHAHYYPMRAGNSWEFTGSANAGTERITAAVKDSVGVTHYAFDHLRWMDSVQLRFAGDDKVYLTAGGVEQPWLDFGATPGTRWTINDPFSPSAKIEVQLESVTDSVTVPAGSFRDVYRFSFTGGMDNTWVEYYAPYTGPVKREFSGIAFWVYNLAVFREADTTASASAPAPAPACVALLGSYPNPVTGRASVRFRVETASARVRLTLHDLLGREVAELAAGEYARGEHAQLVDATALPTGLYYCRLQAPGVLRALPVVVAR